MPQSHDTNNHVKKQERLSRMARALRQNLLKRKQQQRGRNEKIDESAHTPQPHLFSAETSDKSLESDTVF